MNFPPKQPVYLAPIRHEMKRARKQKKPVRIKPLWKRA